MGTSRRQVLRRRYLSLGLGELAAAGVFLTIALAMVVPRLDEESRLALWFALVPLLVVLVQAGIYWLLARSWVERHPMPPSLRTIYRAFRRIDLALLVGGLLGVMVWLPDNLGTGLGVLAIWFFGVIEYVNYFAIRLSYPPRLWLSTVGQLRTPRLVRDLNTGS
ncbi:hypothetical protein [Rhodococcus sp. IEGM1428]|uniref:hypothetical protein n=1 Tax=Rhodococcus sp. IEGM1428 TaxID=3392191 RepID=UPI003D0BCA7B